MKKEPGLIDVPGRNDLCPHARNARPDWQLAPGKASLRYAQGMQSVHDYGSPDGGFHGSQNPSSARFTPGLPTAMPKEEKDKRLGTMQPLIAP